MYSPTEQEFLKKYLKKISKIPLLTPEEEKELARRAKEGDKEALKKTCRIKSTICGIGSTSV